MTRPRRDWATRMVAKEREPDAPPNSVNFIHEENVIALLRRRDAQWFAMIRKLKKEHQGSGQLLKGLRAEALDDLSERMKAK